MKNNAAQVVDSGTFDDLNTSSYAKNIRKHRLRLDCTEKHEQMTSKITKRKRYNSQARKKFFDFFNVTLAEKIFRSEK